MSNPLISTRKLAAFALALGVTAVVHLGVWECAAANAWQVARASQAGRAAQPVPAVTITALDSPAQPHTLTA